MVGDARVATCASSHFPPACVFMCVPGLFAGHSFWTPVQAIHCQSCMYSHLPCRVLLIVVRNSLFKHAVQSSRQMIMHRFTHPPPAEIQNARIAWLTARAKAKQMRRHDLGDTHAFDAFKKADRAAVLANWLVQTYGREHLNQGSGVHQYNHGIHVCAIVHMKDPFICCRHGLPFVSFLPS